MLIGFEGGIINSKKIDYIIKEKIVRDEYHSIFAVKYGFENSKEIKEYFESEESAVKRIEEITEAVIENQNPKKKATKKTTNKKKK